MILPQQGDTGKYTGNCVSQPNPNGQGEAQPVSDRETCPRGREGLVTQAVVATSAWDMSVGAIIEIYMHVKYQMSYMSNISYGYRWVLIENYI